MKVTQLTTWRNAQTDARTSPGTLYCTHVKRIKDGHVLPFWLLHSSFSIMALTLLDIAHATASKLSAFNFLKDRHLLATDPTCPKCQTPMRLHAASASLVGFIWTCPDRACRAKLSVLHGSMFQNSKLSLRVIVFLIYEWARDIPQDIVALISLIVKFSLAVIAGGKSCPVLLVQRKSCPVLLVQRPKLFLRFGVNE